MTFRSFLPLTLCYFLLACAEPPTNTSGDNTTLTKVNLSENNSLSDQIWTVFQDSQGTYWFGTNGNGLYCWSNEGLQHFTKRNGLIDNSIRGIQEDSAGRLFVETPRGVHRWDDFRFTPLKEAPASESAWQLEPNDLWFNCNGNGLYRCDGERLYGLELPEMDLMSHGMATTGVSFPNMNSSSYAVYGIDKDKDGNMWFGTVTAGAFRYDGTSFLWFGEPELSTLPDGRVPGVRSILEDVNGYYWLSNFYSKYKVDPQAPMGYHKMKAVDLPEEVADEEVLYFNSGLVDQYGNLWMTTYDGRVWTYDGEKLSNTDVTNDQGVVLLVSIYEDREGILWLGTNNDGVYRQSANGFKKFELPD